LILKEKKGKNMPDDKRWSVFPAHKYDQHQKRKKFLTIKVKSLLLVFLNLILIGVYLYIRQDANILEIILRNPVNIDVPMIFEFLVLLVFIILTIVGLILWIYFFIKDKNVPSDEQKENYILRSWYETKFDVDVVIIIALLIRLIIQPFSVFGSSMEPNFHDQEYIIVNSIGYRLHKPTRGDVIVFKFPENKTKNYIKRIIGLPGERVVIEDDKIEVFNQQYPSGTFLNEDYLPLGTKTVPRSNKNYSDFTLAGNEYYVLGDNREASSDSREWGPLPENLIIGKSWVVCWPISDWQVVPSVNYNLESSSTYLLPSTIFAYQ
jgi:signal peptidase I